MIKTVKWVCWGGFCNAAGKEADAASFTLKDTIRDTAMTCFLVEFKKTYVGMMTEWA